MLLCIQNAEDNGCGRVRYDSVSRVSASPLVPLCKLVKGSSFQQSLESTRFVPLHNGGFKSHLLPWLGTFVHILHRHRQKSCFISRRLLYSHSRCFYQYLQHLSLLWKRDQKKKKKNLFLDYWMEVAPFPNKSAYTRECGSWESEYWYFPLLCTCGFISTGFHEPNSISQVREFVLVCVF